MIRNYEMILLNHTQRLQSKIDTNYYTIAFSIDLKISACTFKIFKLNFTQIIFILLTFDKMIYDVWGISRNNFSELFNITYI